jgi:hypothetical protein
MNFLLHVCEFHTTIGNRVEPSGEGSNMGRGFSPLFPAAYCGKMRRAYKYLVANLTTHTRRSPPPGFET